MNRIVELAGEIVALAVVVIALGWLLLRTLKRSEDPPRLIFKWVLTALIVGLMKWKAIPLAGRGGGDSYVGVVLALLCGLVLTAIWRHSIASIVASPFGALYDGGDVEPEPHPAYSVAQSRQKQGKYLEAVAEIRKQLDRFPTDVEGHLLLAQIQAEDLKDLPGAELTIQRFCAQPGHASKNIAYALYSLADWYMKIGQDRESARRALEKIVELFPDSEFGLGAAQRIAH